MKIRLIVIACALVAPLTLNSCMTTYDANGNPVQSVSPEGAAAIAVGAAVVGYALSQDNDHHHYHGGGYGYYRPRRCYY